LRAGILQDDVKFGLLFDGGGRSGSAHRHHTTHHHRGGGGHAKFVFQCLLKLNQLKHGHFFDGFDNLLHGYTPLWFVNYS
jgi:hypothetical protein